MLKTIYLETTTTCNLHCAMCPRFGKESVSNLPVLMPVEVFNRVRSVFSAGKTIALVGCGEPTTDRRLLDFVAAANSAGMFTMFTTNGMWLDRSLGERIIASGLMMLGVSIDGATPGTFEKIRSGASFTQVIYNLKNFLNLRSTLASSRPVVKLQIVLMRSNIGELPALVEMAADLGVEEVYGKNLCFLRNNDLAQESLQEEYNPSVNCRERDLVVEQALAIARERGVRIVVPAYQRNGPNSCPYHPTETVFIRRNGDVFPCPVYAVWNDGLTPDVIAAKRLGNVLTSSPEAIWDSKSSRAFRDHFSAGEVLECLGCTVWRQGYKVASRFPVTGYTY